MPSRDGAKIIMRFLIGTKADLIDQRTQIIRRIANIAQSRNVGSAAHNGT
jgi:hypothetical protein